MAATQRTVAMSAVLIVRDGERHLERVLRALSACDEILVLDSGSSDRTVAIAEAAGARVVVQEFLGYGPQKRRAVALARHDWIISIDDDEILDEEAAAAICGLDLSDPGAAWRIRRRNCIGNREVRHGQWNPDRPLRIFNRTVADFNDAMIHESVIGPSRIRDLPGSMLHLSYTGIINVFERMPAYARIRSAIYRQSGRTASPPLLVLRLVHGFLRSYVFKLGFLDGILGVVVAVSVGLDAVLALSDASVGPEGPEPGPMGP